ncbi:MAG: sigma-70 family RNA polymerase sigma factor [Planctomycetales bacterium]
MSREQDQTFLARIAEGDAAAMAELIQKYRPQLLGYIEKNLSDGLKRKIEAEDVLQEVSIHAVRSLGEMDFAERECFGWLCQIAQRRIIDAHRKFFGAQKRAAHREVGIHASPDQSQGGIVDLLVASMTTASQAMSRNMREAQMHQALGELPEETQLVLKLRYVEGLATKEIAEKIGKRDGTVRVLISRAVAKLQQMLAPEEES